MSRQAPKAIVTKAPRKIRIGVVVARFNAKVTEALLDGCLERLRKLGVPEKNIEVHRVPGAFELPLAARMVARTGKVEAVICLGAVIRGETPHFDYVAGEAARGIAAVGLKERLPVIFGVLTTNNEQQAWDRCGGKHGHAGERAADAAIEMIQLLRYLKE